MKVMLLQMPTMRSGTIVLIDIVAMLTPAAKKPINDA